MQILLVTGGRSGSVMSQVVNNYLSSTEIMKHGTWSFVAPLHSNRALFRAGTLDNSVFVFGEHLSILLALDIDFYFSRSKQEEQAALEH